MQCEDCEEEPSIPARTLDELLHALSPEASGRLLHAIAASCDGARTLRELLQDGAACALLLKQLRLVSTMPEDAASTAPQLTLHSSRKRSCSPVGTSACW